MAGEEAPERGSYKYYCQLVRDLQAEPDASFPCPRCLRKEIEPVGMVRWFASGEREAQLVCTTVSCLWPLCLPRELRRKAIREAKDEIRPAEWTGREAFYRHGTEELLSASPTQADDPQQVEAPGSAEVVDGDSAPVEPPTPRPRQRGLSGPSDHFLPLDESLDDDDTSPVKAPKALAETPPAAMETSPAKSRDPPVAPSAPPKKPSGEAAKKPGPTESATPSSPKSGKRPVVSPTASSASSSAGTRPKSQAELFHEGLAEMGLHSPTEPEPRYDDGDDGVTVEQIHPPPSADLGEPKKEATDDPEAAGDPQNDPEASGEEAKASPGDSGSPKKEPETGQTEETGTVASEQANPSAQAAKPKPPIKVKSPTSRDPETASLDASSSSQPSTTKSALSQVAPTLTEVKLPTLSKSAPVAVAAVTARRTLPRRAAKLSAEQAAKLEQLKATVVRESTGVSANRSGQGRKRKSASGPSESASEETLTTPVTSPVAVVAKKPSPPLPARGAPLPKAVTTPPMARASPTVSTPTVSPTTSTGRKTSPEAGPVAPSKTEMKARLLERLAAKKLVAEAEARAAEAAAAMPPPPTPTPAAAPLSLPLDIPPYHITATVNESMDTSVDFDFAHLPAHHEPPSADYDDMFGL